MIKTNDDLDEWINGIDEKEIIRSVLKNANRATKPHLECFFEGKILICWLSISISFLEKEDWNFYEDNEVIALGLLRPHNEGGFCEYAKIMLLQNNETAQDGTLSYVAEISQYVLDAFEKVCKQVPKDVIISIMEFVVPECLRERVRDEVIRIYSQRGRQTLK